MDPENDAYGQAMRAHHEGEESFEVVERDDGYVGLSSGPGTYFSEYDDWSDSVQEALDRARGRVLDVGCGAGRHALYLQEQGHDVLGIDVSPGAIDVCRERGVERAEVLDVGDVSALDEPFDTVLMFGNNFGLVGTADCATKVLSHLAEVTNPDAQILGESMDPTATDEPAHLAYHELNRQRDRLPGALRIRIRFQQYATDWFDYLLADPDEMADIVTETPWRVSAVIEDEDDAGAYVGVLEKGTGPS